MNLAEAIAHIDAMTPDEKAAWDKANGFLPEAVRDAAPIRKANWRKKRP